MNTACSYGAALYAQGAQATIRFTQDSADRWRFRPDIGIVSRAGAWAAVIVSQLAMRLYLSSYRFGDRPADLLALMRGGRRAIIVSNALDNIPRSVRVMYEATVYDQREAFAAIGVDADHLDLRAYFGHQGGLRERLAANDLVWVTGGNSFLLMRAMVQSGFIPLIREMLARDKIVYGGYSAGAVVATPSLRGIDLMDAPHEIAEGYEPAAIWDGMGLVDFSIVPHYRSNHPESPLAEKVADYLTANKTKFITLRDGEVFVRDDG